MLGSLLALLASLGPADAAPAEPAWVASWSAAMQPPPPGAQQSAEGQTLRLVLHSSVAGQALRLRLSNAYGKAPLRIDGAAIGLRAQGADAVPGSLRALRFQGSTLLSIAPGESAVSDALAMAVPADAELLLSLHLPEATPLSSLHWLTRQDSYLSPAGPDMGALAHFPVGRVLAFAPFASELDVQTEADVRPVLALGDSQVDGDGASEGRYTRWTDALAHRLQRVGQPRAVLNQGLIGARLLRDTPERFGGLFGPSVLQRFEQLLREQPGPGVLLLQVGANDIGLPGTLAPADEAPTLQSLGDGYEALARRAHAQGWKLYVFTLAPFEGARMPAPGYWNADKEALRQALNHRLRKGGSFDGVMDADALLRDPRHPTRLDRRFDSGDHLHPNDAGYARLAEALPLDWFR